MRMFSVIEYSSFFAVRHNPTTQERPMGDGVDALFDDEFHALSPGDDGFREEWENRLNEDEQDTLEAYFPEIAENESLLETARRLELDHGVMLGELLRRCQSSRTVERIARVLSTPDDSEDTP